MTGGAAKGALNLHHELLRQNVDSTIINNGKKLDVRDMSIKIPNGTIEKNIYNWNYLLGRARLSGRKIQHKYAPFSTGYEGISLKSLERRLRNADIVHLHWINGLLSLKSPFVQTPGHFVWTLRDYWPLTGGCHYPINCELYKSTCERCPIMGQDNTANMRRIVDLKINFFKNTKIKLVCVSNVLKQAANESIYSQHIDDMEVIHNGIDCTTFRPRASSFRKDYLVNNEQLIITIVAQSLEIQYKGYNLFLEVVEILERMGYGHKLVVQRIGSCIPDATRNYGKTRFIDCGFVQSEKALSELYSSSDLFVSPSIMDAFPKAPIEAMACETPVLCFKGTGTEDVIINETNGYAVENGNVYEMANRIIQFTNNSPEKINWMKKQARQTANSMCNIEKIAKSYIAVYNNLIL